ncbi:MAG: NUDIX hydrolase [Myxococcaceae bacterium]|nr:MAG: NUDIX hydrolase [Myxococcaceae bacterium]
MEPRFCSFCAAPTELRIPEGDHLPRRVCTRCGTVHYENPRVIVGCVVEHGPHLLLCRRAIEPRRGYWTIPAGFMENGETLEAGAARECQEEALATVEIGSLLLLASIVRAHQVHAFFRAKLLDGGYGAGPESLETKLVLPADIPWDDLAFPSTRAALEAFLADRAAGREDPHVVTIDRRFPTDAWQNTRPSGGAA